MVGVSKDALQVDGCIGEKSFRSRRELVRRRMARTRPYEISGYMAHTHDFAAAIAEADYAEVARLDPELASALRKIGGE